MTYNFIDTSAILEGALETISHCYISPVSLMELENIKDKREKIESVRAEARQAIRTLITDATISITNFNQKEIEKIIKKYNFLLNIHDHFILAAAELFGRKEKHMVFFYTCDGAQFAFAKLLPHLQPILYKRRDCFENYTGWQEVFPTDEELACLYAHPEQNIFNLKCNEYAKIFVEDKIVDVEVWTGEKYRSLVYKNIKNNYTDELIKPRNVEQKMYMDLLQNKQIPIKLCIAPFGTGKSYLALNYALQEIQHGRFDKLVFVKNNLEVKGAGTLGILPGSSTEKQYPWLLQIADHIGVQNFEEYLESGIIEPAHLSTLRGRDLKNCIIIVDEAENLLASNIQLLIGRVAENSEIVFCADVKQCDYKKETDSGIPKLIRCLAGQPLFGMVKLVKTERSKVAAMADLMD